MNAGREFGIVTAGLTKYPPRSFFKWEREYRRSGSQGQTLTSTSVSAHGSVIHLVPFFSFDVRGTIWFQGHFGHCQFPQRNGGFLRAQCIEEDHSCVDLGEYVE